MGLRVGSDVAIARYAFSLVSKFIPPGASMQPWPAGCVLVSKHKPLHSSAGAKRISLLRDMPAPYEELFIFVIESVFIICLHFFQVLSY